MAWVTCPTSYLIRSLRAQTFCSIAVTGSRLTKLGVELALHTSLTGKSWGNVATSASAIVTSPPGAEYD